MIIARRLRAPLRGATQLRQFLYPGLLAGAALATAFIGAALIGSDTGLDGINGFVDSLSGESGTSLGNLGLVAPLGFAFAAGMASAVNPCGFAMLPAYLGLYLGTNEEETLSRHPARRMGRAVVIGAAVTAGLMVLFGGAGTIIGLGARALIVDVLPWVGLVIGIGLSIIGAWLVFGGKLYTGMAPGPLLALETLLR